MCLGQYGGTYESYKSTRLDCYSWRDFTRSVTIDCMKKKLLFWVPNSLLVLAMVASAISYFIDIPTTAENFAMLGYPSYVLYFNGIAKILGGIVILVPAVHPVLKEWAYAGYLFILLLALQALVVKMPEMAAGVLVFVVAWGLSYWQYRVQKAR